MRLAWFRPAQPAAADPLDDTAALITELRSTHDIDVVTRDGAHDFVWQHFRAPYDLCVFELDNTPAHAFIWPYLLHYPGVAMLRSLMLNDSRAGALARDGRLDDYRAEFMFSGDARLLRAPLLASRLTVVAHAAAADALQEEFPDARVRFAPIGVPDVQAPQPQRPTADVIVAVMPGSDADVAQRACQRARDAGARVTLMVAGTCGADSSADIVIGTRWPPFGEPDTPALAAMAAGKPVIVMETEMTADWPAYDPQTWRPRGHGHRAPIVVSVDPRDEEHSLMVAIRDLARDRGMREALGTAAHDWWRTRATVAHAAAAWQTILAEAATLPPPPRPADWPRHLTADGTEAARAVLDEIGAAVDFLR